MPLSAAQQTVADSNSRFRVCVAGRRFGKTHLAIREMARFSSIPESLVLYIAPTYGQAKNTVWDKLRDKMISLRWAAKVNESSLTITLKNSSKIMLRSADNFDSMRGLGVNFAVFDEFADIKQEAWTHVIRPALSDREGHAMFIGTPKGAQNWAKELFDHGGVVPGWESFQFTTLQGGNVSAEEIEAARNDMDERTFRQEYEATFETYANVIYYAFDGSQVIHEEIEPERNEILHIGMDFNTNPMSAVVAVHRNGKLIVLRDIEIFGSDTQEMCDEIRNLYPKHTIYVYPDATGANASTKGKSDHTILRNNGFVVKTGRTNPPVKDRIASVNTALRNAAGESHISFVINKTKRIRNALAKQCYKGDTRIPDKDSGLDHLPDALGYLVHTIMPIRTERNDSKPQQSWRHF